MSRILVLGGYGGFGGRISRRLAAQGHVVLVAGRSGEKAVAFCRGIPCTVPLALARRDLAQALEIERPDLVVDASGPFQAMDRTVPQACIAAGVSYCDIADGRAFVCGIHALDAQARAAGVVVLSGASSVPALSGAVVRHLAQGLSRVRVVEITISASNRAQAGPAVAAAILGQVGQPFTLRRGGRDVTVHGWQEMRCLDFSLPGIAPIRRRRVTLVEVPDIALLPQRLPGDPAVTFRAGAELGMQNWLLWFFSWFVRWGWLASPSKGAIWLLPLQRLTARFGSDRSAMRVSVYGERDGEKIERRWTLIADQGDGPEIPALTVPLLAAHMAARTLAPGARDAGEALALADFEGSFAALAIRHRIEEVKAAPCLYRRVMGACFARLPPAVQAMHDFWRDGGGRGEADVAGSRSWAGRIVSRLMRFPPPGHHALHVSFQEQDGVETWTRDFGGYRFSSRLSASGSCLVERFGPLQFHFDLPLTSGGLAMEMRGWRAFGVPLPLFLAPRSRAREWEAEGRFHFDVPISLPLIGLLVHYRGWLRPVP